MFIEKFILSILGHFVGDFLFQTKKMALGKSTRGIKGVLICTFHVLIYTAAVSFFISSTNPLVWVAIFIPHWLIDRWSLAGKWLKLIGGRTFESAFNSSDKYREFDVAFTAVVYTVADTTIHVLCLLPVIKYLL